MSSSFEAKDFQIPSKSNPCVDDNQLLFSYQITAKSDHNQLLSSNQITAKSDHNLSSNYQTSLKSPPPHQRPTEADPLKDHRISNNHNQPPPPPSQQQPLAPTLYSNVEQPNKDNHAKLTSAEPPVKNIHPKNYLSQNEAPPSQPISPDQHILKNPPLPPSSRSPSPQTRTLSWNVEQPTNYKEHTNQVTSTEPKTDYPEHYLSQPDGPPPPQPYPLPLTPSPKDQLKNVKAPAARNPPPKRSCCTCSIL